MRRHRYIKVALLLLIASVSWGEEPSPLDQIQEQINSPEFKKMQKQAEKMMRRAQQNPNAAADWEKNQKVLQYTDIIIKTHWDFAGDYKAQWTPDVMIKSHRHIIADRDFMGRIWKTLPEANRGQTDYGFDAVTPDTLSVQQASGQTIIEGKGGGARCDVTEWKEGVASLGGNGTAQRGILVGVDPGIRTPGVCKDPMVKGPTDHPTLILDAPPLSFVMTRADFEMFEKEGRIEREYSGSVVYREGMDLLTVGNRLVNMASDSRLKDWSYQGTLHVEILSSPVISGPHFLALAPDTLGLTDNQIILRSHTPKGWQVGKITPVGGWGTASKIVKRYMEIPGSEQQLILKPVAPGRVKFQVEWTSPKGKHGKSPVFEVTVVQLKFKKKEICQGFDDSNDRVNLPVDGASLCTELPKTVAVEIQPAGTHIETRLVVPPAIKVMGDTQWNAFPHDVVMQGLRASNEILHMEVLVDKDKWQLATDLSVDALKTRHIKVLPVILNPDPLELDPGSEFFSVSNDDMRQLCVVLDKMHPVPLQDRNVPGYTEGGNIQYMGSGAPLLSQYARDHMNVGQEVTAYFVPVIIGSEVIGFQDGNVVYVMRSAVDPHVLSHEIGHYLLGEMYTSLEGSYHTTDAKMIMYHNAGSGCEFRQKEWRKAHAH